MPAGASKCTHPSPSDGCSPRTRATSYAMPATLELPPFRENFATAAGALNAQDVRSQPVGLPEPGHPASHTSRVGLGFGTLIALFLLIAPGAIVGRIAQLTWPIAVAVAAGADLRRGGTGDHPVRRARNPLERLDGAGRTGRGVPADDGSAVAVCPLSRHRAPKPGGSAAGRRSTVAAGVLLGALLVMLGGVARPRALAVRPQHLGRGLARQRGAVHPRHRPGVVDPHGRAPQRRNTRSRCITRRCSTR